MVAGKRHWGFSKPASGQWDFGFFSIKIGLD